MNCIHCGKEIDPRFDYQRVIGWGKIRARASISSDVVGRSLEQEWACDKCVIDEKAGHLHQETMI